MLLGLLLALNILICLALIGVVLLQRSEGGALGGSPTGLITTRGAGDLLTRTTWVLFSLFLVLSLALTLLGGRERSSQATLNHLKLQSVDPAALHARQAAATAAAARTATPGAPGAAAPAPTPTGLAAPTPRVQVPAAGGQATPASLPLPGAPLPTVALPPLGAASPAHRPAPPAP